MQNKCEANYDWFKLACSSDAIIGPSGNNIEKCRFCGKIYTPSDFSQRTHVVSESLGNRGVVSSDECDECNNYFSHIEQDFFTANKYFLILDDIVGKNGNSPCFNQGNFKFYNTGEHLVIQVPKSEEKPIMRNLSKGHLIIERMGNNDKFRPRNVYKSLVKYAMSILPIDRLSPFCKTLDWIRGKQNEDGSLCLHTVFHSIVSPSTTPIIQTFIQSTTNYELPYAWGIFQCASIRYYFIIPYAGEWECNLSNNDTLKKFLLLIFNHDEPTNLTSDDFSSSNLHRVKFETHIKIES